MKDEDILFELDERVYHDGLGNGTVKEFSSNYTYMGTKQILITVQFDKYMMPHYFNETDYHELKHTAKQPLVSNGCECGAHHTEFKDKHMFFCRLYKPTTRG
jgi:hypothetical protein